MSAAPFYVVLLHDQMVDRQQTLVTTSITLIDVHDLARSSRTFGVAGLFVAHPSVAQRKLSGMLKNFWEEGFGATYNPNRREALEHVRIVSDLDEAIHHIDLETGQIPRLIATSAKAGGTRTSFRECKELLATSPQPSMMMLGTGWGMSEGLLARADLFLEPVCGPGEYNHLSVRSACAIMLDRLFGT